ncbi:MAG: radical SAM protein [Anaerolineae bacterium]|jgi:MoaA/NifB/PqqE/SkfB family radical SAM enzyme|nr:radical SAM protein [Anaerolineae bacterium]
MLEKRNYYRLPWSMNDNPIAWLEVTDICNIHCEGCYRQYMTGHKSLEELKEEVLFFMKWRNPDNFSIAGGEPLIHPQIVDLVAFIAQQGVKPVILSNGVALTPELLHELKKAGLAGFTMHVDSHQNRPHWNDKNEKEHNQLRQEIADMVAAEGGLYLVFNSTVYPDTYHEIPDIVRWGHANIEKVQGLVFITYRTATTEDNIATDVNDQEVDMSKLSYTRESFHEHFVTAPEVYQIIKDNFPEYDAAGYLGGSIRHDSYKWLIGVMVGSKNNIYGSIGKKTMEFAQIGHHLQKGRYLAYMTSGKIGRKIFWMSHWDDTIRQARRNRRKDVVRHPARLFDDIFIQSVGIIQAPDIMPDGRADMCDSCPDITIYDGKFVNSCRMDEYRLFGGFVSMVEKDKVGTKSES